MKRVGFVFLFLLLVCSGSRISAQVFGYPGARWVFHVPYDIGWCAEVYEIWEYTGDTIINGDNAKTISITSKMSFYWDPNSYFPASHWARYFKVSGDTVSVLNSADTSWVELYNFSVGIGDSVNSPIDNILNGFSESCSDTLVYSTKGVVIDTGTVLMYGQNLRYYTIQYFNSDTTTANVTYNERLIMNSGYWYPSPLVCNTSDWCNLSWLICYKDDGMITDSMCTNVGWIETLSLQEPPEEFDVKIFPNPTTHQLFVEESLLDGRYMIISLDGRQLSGWMQSPANVASLEPGIYLLVNESRTWTKKFIKN